MDIPSALSAIATTIGIVKDIREIDKGVETGQLKAQLAEVMSILADVKIALLDAQEETRLKDAEIAKLKASFATKAETISFRGYSMLSFEDGGPRGMPFCPRCETVDGLLIHVVDKGSDCQCPQCKALYSQAPRYMWER